MLASVWIELLAIEQHHIAETAVDHSRSIAECWIG
jgi:hypothetical protein